MTSHAHGLISYCKESPRLCVDIRVVWRVVVLQSWSTNSQRLDIAELFVKFAMWLREASLLSDQGMTGGQCTLTFRQEELGLTQRGRLFGRRETDREVGCNPGRTCHGLLGAVPTSSRYRHVKCLA
ncbi:hypothetical protein PSPO01_11693 [Paraphaeosphaeria sporulosa]